MDIDTDDWFDDPSATFTEWSEEADNEAYVDL
jgi:hypothetical protein